MTFLRLFLIAFFITSFFSRSYAQTLHATTDAGKEVALKSDGTWSYIKSATGGKRFRDQKGLFEIQLAADDEWKENRDSSIGDAEFSFKDEDKYSYALVVTENIPLGAEELFHYFWTSQDSTKSKVISTSPLTVNGAPGTYYVFDFENEGLKFRGGMFVYTGDTFYVKVFGWGFRTVLEKNPELLPSLIQKLHVEGPGPRSK